LSFPFSDTSCIKSRYHQRLDRKHNSCVPPRGRRTRSKHPCAAPHQRHLLLCIEVLGLPCTFLICLLSYNTALPIVYVYVTPLAWPRAGRETTKHHRITALLSPFSAFVPQDTLHACPTSLKRLARSPLASPPHTHTLSLSFLSLPAVARLTTANPPSPIQSYLSLPFEPTRADHRSAIQ